MNYKKCLYGVGIFMISCMLSGCCIKHDWQEANCTNPKTCNACGKTEGEALGHTWEEATCTEPKTCKTCGETEGEALGHTWEEATCTEPETCKTCNETQGEALGHKMTEANYQSPATCTVCGETEGEPLVADYITYDLDNIVCNAQENIEYDYITKVNDSPDIKTVGKLTFSDYQTFDFDDAHPPKEGYEWKTVRADIVFSDEDNGYEWKFVGRDYYTCGVPQETHVAPDGDIQVTVNFNGVEYTECETDYFQDSTDWVNGSKTVSIDFVYLLPKDYDGRIIAFIDGSIDTTGKAFTEYADENAVVFRLK